MIDTIHRLDAKCVAELCNAAGQDIRASFDDIVAATPEAELETQAQLRVATLRRMRDQLVALRTRARHAYFKTSGIRIELSETEFRLIASVWHKQQAMALQAQTPASFRRNADPRRGLRVIEAPSADAEVLPLTYKDGF